MVRLGMGGAMGICMITKKKAYSQGYRDAADGKAPIFLNGPMGQTILHVQWTHPEDFDAWSHEDRLAYCSGYYASSCVDR